MAKKKSYTNNGAKRTLAQREEYHRAALKKLEVRKQIDTLRQSLKTGK